MGLRDEVAKAKEVVKTVKGIPGRTRDRVDQGKELVARVKALPEKTRQRYYQAVALVDSARAKKQQTGLAYRQMANAARRWTGRDPEGILEVIMAGLKALELLDEYDVGKRGWPTFRKRIKGFEVVITAAGWVYITAYRYQSFQVLIASLGLPVPQRLAVKHKAGATEPGYVIIEGQTILTANGLGVVGSRAVSMSVYLVHLGQDPYKDRPRFMPPEAILAEAQRDETSKGPRQIGPAK